MRAGFPGRMTPARGKVFKPTLIPNLSLWLDASDHDTILDSGGSVSQWNDKSGNGNNVTQGTGSAQPTTNATTQNGKNIIDFDGNDTLIVPSGLYTIPQGSNTTFIVAKQTINNGDEVIFGILNSGAFRYVFRGTTTAGQLQFSNGDAVAEVAASGVTRTNMNTYRVFRSGTTQGISVNGGAASTNTSAADATNANAAYIASYNGSAAFMTGSIAEILIYDRALSAAEVLSINTYLSNKWGVT